MMTLDRLPGSVRTCSNCEGLFVFARTVATERGRGGKLMPLDVIPDPAGNVAARWNGRTLYARVLAKDEGHDTTAEVLAMPHFATCTKRINAKLHDDVETFLKEASQGGEAP